MEFEKRHEEFKEKYPKTYAGFWFWRNLFEGIETDIENTIIIESESKASDTFFTHPLWVYMSAGIAIIEIKRNIAEELESVGYFLSKDEPPKRRSLDEEIFHEFLHVLGFYKPKMFTPGRLIIDFVPVWLTHVNPPRTVEGIIERVKIINRWWKEYAKEENTSGTRYTWLKEKYR